MEKVPYWDIVKAVSKFNFRVREVEKRDGYQIKKRFTLKNLIKNIKLF